MAKNQPMARDVLLVRSLKTQRQKGKSTMKAIHPMTLVVNATKPIITGLALAVAMMFLPHDALATPNGTSILHFAFKSAMTNTGVDPDASGNVNGNLIRQGNANSLLLTISLAKLDPNTTYQLAAIIGDDTSPTSVTNFTTTSKGAFAVKYVNKGRVAGGNPLPDVLSPLCSVRELDIVNGSGQTVLRSDLTDPDSLQYSVNSFMANTGFIPNAVGRLQINATKHHTQFRLTASGLTPNTAYVLMINGNAAQTNATDRVGKLKLTALPPGSTDVLGINMLALTDSSGNNVVLTTNGLGVPCDFTAPTVSFTVPANAATGVAANQKIAVTFSEAMNPATITTTSFTLKQGTTAVTGTVSYVGVTATFTPATGLAPLTTYAATITTGAEDLAGNALATDFVWSFTTGAAPDTTPPTVSFVVPANAATGVAIGGNIAAAFSEAMDPLTISTATFTLKQGTTVVTGTVSYAGVTATFNPLNNLAPSTTYTATITTGARDLAGNALATAFVWSFTTGTTPDTTPPTVSFVVPANAATGVATNQNIAAAFSEAMDPLTISTATFTLKQGTTVVTGTVSYAGVTATFNPLNNLAPSTTYTATITTGARDLAGNALATAFVWSFTTGAAPDTTPPTVSFVVPANTATGVATNQNIAAVFSKAMDPLTISTATFTLKQGTTVVTGTVSYVGVTATFRPVGNLAPLTVYTATISTGATDLAGNALATDFVWSFTTVATPDTTPPTVSSTVPADGDTGVAIGGNIAAAFGEAMDTLTISTATFTLKQGATVVTGTVTYAGVTATFRPVGNLAPLTTYTATISTGATDLAGNALTTDFVWSFITGTTPDTTPPTVSSTVPADGDTGVAINRNIAATFGEAMDSLTISTATFTLKQGATAVTGTVSYVGVTATFTPATALMPSTLYTATITTGATDLASNALTTDFVWSFMTGASTDTTRPTVSSTIPTNTATGVPINSRLAATFSKAMDSLTISTATFTLKQETTVVTGTVTYAGVTATFRPVGDLAPLTTYTATITTGAKDLAGNTLATNFVWSFTTGETPATTPPTVSSTVPADVATNVAINQTINATFSEDMDPLTISTANFMLTGPGATAVTGTVTYVATSKIASFTPASYLAPNTTYTNTITTGATDLAGNAMATNFVWSFTTGTQIDTNLMSINLGTASTFAIMATAAISGGGDQINGDVGLHSGASQGIPPSEINGTIHVNDQAIIDAQTDLLAAYNEAVNRSANLITLTDGEDVGGHTLYPGLYWSATSLAIGSSGGPTEILYLDAQGDPNAVFVFQMGSTLTVFPYCSIVLSGGAQAKNVYWQVGSSATLSGYNIFKGNILADVSIVVDAGSAVEGRLFAGSGPGGAGAVTVQSSTITVPAP
jgi:hypothetical protein